MLSQTITFSPDQGRIEDVTYSGDGTVHLREIMTVEADCRKSIVERYQPDGDVRDRWLIQYDRDGRRSCAQRYGADGRFLGESPPQQYQPVAAVDEEAPEHDSPESVEREFDSYGNWIREIRYQRTVEGDTVVRIPTIATYRTITYFQN